MLGGSWVVLSGVTSRVTLVITHIRGLVTIVITTHGPPSRRVQHTKDSRMLFERQHHGT